MASLREMLAKEDLEQYASDTEFVEAYGDEGFEKVCLVSHLILRARSITKKTCLRLIH